MDRNTKIHKNKIFMIVAPRRGAWIEIEIIIPQQKATVVAPRRGAWIEIQNEMRNKYGYDVAPRRGAWIEIKNTSFFRIK